MREVAQLLLPSVRWDPAHGFAPAMPAVMRAVAAGVGGFDLFALKTLRRIFGRPGLPHLGQGLVGNCMCPLPKS